MKNKNIFEKNAKIPDIVQQKANAAFRTIYTREDEAVEKPQKTNRSTRTMIISIASTAAVAAITVAVIFVSLAYFCGKGPELPGGSGQEPVLPSSSGQVTIANYVEPFTIKVCAAELGPKTSLPISLDVGQQSFGYYIDWEGSSNFQLNFPISVEGENISSVNFKASNAVFEVVSIDCPSIVKSGSPKTLKNFSSTYVDGYDMSGHPIGKTEVGYYDSFSADYDTLHNSKYILNICNVMTNRMDIYYLSTHEDDGINNSVTYTYLIKDVEVKIEVTFKDGTTASRSLGLYANTYTAEDKMDDGTEYTYETVQIFCYDKNAIDNATKQLISRQLARAAEICKAGGINTTGGDATEPTDNTEATVSTETTANTDATAVTETTVNTEPTAGTEPTSGTDATDSTEPTAGTDTTVSTETTAGTEETKSTDEVSSTENTDNVSSDN